MNSLVLALLANQKPVARRCCAEKCGHLLEIYDGPPGARAGEL